MRRLSIFGRGEYPLRVRILVVASVVWLVSALVGGLYALYLGIPIIRINPVFLPSVIFGLAMSLIASVWRVRIDRATKIERKGKELHS